MGLPQHALIGGHGGRGAGAGGVCALPQPGAGAGYSAVATVAGAAGGGNCGCMRGWGSWCGPCPCRPRRRARPWWRGCRRASTWPGCSTRPVPRRGGRCACSCRSRGGLYLVAIIHFLVSPYAFRFFLRRCPLRHRLCRRGLRYAALLLPGLRVPGRGHGEQFLQPGRCNA